MNKKNVKKKLITLEEFEKDFTPEDRKLVDKYKKYYKTMMLVRENRKKLGWTQRELAEKVNLPRTTITKLESGNRNVTVQTLVKIATAMGKKLVIEFR